MSSYEVEAQGQRLCVRRTSKRGLRTVNFTMEGRQYAAIDQNLCKPSRWGQLARSGHSPDSPITKGANKLVVLVQW